MRLLLQSLLSFGTIQASFASLESNLRDDETINDTPRSEPIISTSAEAETKDRSLIISSPVSPQNLHPSRSRYVRSASSTTTNDVAISSGNTVTAPSVIITSLIGGFAALTLIFVAVYLIRRKKSRRQGRSAEKQSRSTRKHGRSTGKESIQAARKVNDIDLEAARPNTVQPEKLKRPDHPGRPNQVDRPSRPTQPNASSQPHQPDRPPRPDRPAEALDLHRTPSRPSNFSRPLSRGLPSRPRRSKSADAISRAPLPKDTALPPLPPLQPGEARRPLSKRAEAIRRPTSDRLPDPRRSRSADTVSRRPLADGGSFSRPVSRGRGEVPPVPVRAMESVPPVPPLPAVPDGNYAEAAPVRTEYFPYVPPSKTADEVRKALLGGLPVNPRPGSRKSEGTGWNARGREAGEVVKKPEREEEVGIREGEGGGKGDGEMLRQDDRGQPEDAMPATLPRARSIRPASSIYPEDSIERMPSMRSTRRAGKTQSRAAEGLQREPSDRTPYRLTYF